MCRSNSSCRPLSFRVQRSIAQSSGSFFSCASVRNHFFFFLFLLITSIKNRKCNTSGSAGYSETVINSTVFFISYSLLLDRVFCPNLGTRSHAPFFRSPSSHRDLASIICFLKPFDRPPHLHPLSF